MVVLAETLSRSCDLIPADVVMLSCDVVLGSIMFYLCFVCQWWCCTCKASGPKSGERWVTWLSRRFSPSLFVEVLVDSNTLVRLKGRSAVVPSVMSSLYVHSSAGRRWSITHWTPTSSGSLWWIFSSKKSRTFALTCEYHAYDCVSVCVGGWVWNFPLPINWKTANLAPVCTWIGQSPNKRLIELQPLRP